MELLAPAGSIDIAYYAFYSGASAVYFAGKNFGARASASNFSLDEIIEISGNHRSGSDRMRDGSLLESRNFAGIPRLVLCLINHSRQCHK